MENNNNMETDMNRSAEGGGVLNALDLDNKKINHYVQNINLNVHHFYINGPIEDDITMYCDLLNILKTANENDTVIMYINSEGGALRMALQIANSMLSTQARVITSLDGQACSAATLLFLAGHEYIINPNCTFMIHNYFGGAWGKGHEIQSQINHLGNTTAKMLRSFYEKILTEDELSAVLDGRDIWMDSEELLDRLEDASQQLETDKLMPSDIPETKTKGKEVSSGTKKKTKKKTAKKKPSRKREK